jgi:hypothetical protein
MTRHVLVLHRNTICAMRGLEAVGGCDMCILGKNVETPQSGKWLPEMVS